MKKVFLYVITFLIIGLGCDTQKINQAEGVISFDKKLECSKFKKNIEDSLYKQSQFGENVALQKIFYSRKKNSCLFEVYYIGSDQFVIKDALTGELMQRLQQGDGIVGEDDVRYKNFLEENDYFLN